MSKVSVIIPTYNRKEDLKDCLASMSRQTFRDFEVIIIDDGSVDGTERISQYSDIRYYKRAHEGCVKSLNFGVSVAKGEVVAVTDDDCIASTNWLALLVGAYDEMIGAVGGRILSLGQTPANEIKPVGTVLLDGTTTANFDSGGPRVRVDYVKGGNMSFRRDVLLSVGLFDENYVGDGYNFEPDCCVRLAKEGFKVLYEPEAIVWHKKSPRPGRFGREGALRNYYWKRNSTLFYLKNIFPRRGLRWLLRHGFLFVVKNLGETILKGEVSYFYGILGLLSGLLAFGRGRHRMLRTIVGSNHATFR